MLNELAQEIHENAKNHGWWENPPSFLEVVALCHSELSEAVEEYRNHKPNAYVLRNTSTFPQYESDYTDITNLDDFKPNEKPEGIGTELADCIIRILDYCAYAGIDIDEIIRLKHEYNKTRPYRHGNKRI
jgi:NTP pyrophosphatase (non-canonical NTP hydrolase)